MSERPLNELQTWLQAAILRGADAAPPEGDGAAQDDVLTASSRQSAAERLAVYQRAYGARLLDVLRREFPVLLHVLGRRAFDGLAAAYLAEHPSQSYTLAELGAAFPGFLADGPRETDGPSAFPQTWTTLLADVAQWERTTCEVYSGPGLEATPFNPGDWADLPPERWLAARLQPAPCLRLVEFRHAVVEFCLGVRRGARPPWPANGASYAAASRLAYRVRWRTLTPSEFRFLQALTAGATVGEALAAHCERETAVADAATELHDWFLAWAREGYFRGSH